MIKAFDNLFFDNYFEQYLSPSLKSAIKRQETWTGNIHLINFLIAFRCSLFVAQSH